MLVMVGDFPLDLDLTITIKSPTTTTRYYITLRIPNKKVEFDLIKLALRAASQPKCEAPLRNEVNQKRTNVRPLLSLLGSFGAIE